MPSDREYDVELDVTVTFRARVRARDGHDAMLVAPRLTRGGDYVHMDLLFGDKQDGGRSIARMTGAAISGRKLRDVYIHHGEHEGDDDAE